MADLISTADSPRSPLGTLDISESGGSVWPPVQAALALWSQNFITKKLHLYDNPTAENLENRKAPRAAQ